MCGRATSLRDACQSGSTTQTTRIWIVPAPAGVAVIGISGLLLGRRRRA